MTTANNGIYNKAIDAYNMPKNVYNAIKKASVATGVNFSYLVEKAAVESSFDTNAKAKTSSATGLYQFIDKTWMAMVRDHGADYGLGKYAAKIDDNGHVADARDRKEILNLRKDPEISAVMNAEYDSDNYQQLKDNVGGNIGSTELYLAHFFGAGGASGFLNAMKKSPDMAAADVFPKEARANRNVFFDSSTGAPRSLGEVYAYFDQKLDGVAGDGAAQPIPAYTVMTAHNFTRGTQAYATASGDAAPSPRLVAENDDTFTRLSGLIGRVIPKSHRTADSVTQTAQNNWQIATPKTIQSIVSQPCPIDVAW